MSRPADAYPFPTFPAPLRFAIALAAVLVVFVMDSMGDSALDEPGKFLLLGTAVLASAWFAGTGPALAATVFGAALGYIGIGNEPRTATQVADSSRALRRTGALADGGRRRNFGPPAAPRSDRRSSRRRRAVKVTPRTA